MKIAKKKAEKIHKDMLLKEMVGSYAIAKYQVGIGPKRRTYWAIFRLSKKQEIPSPTEAIKFVNAVLKTKIDTLDARYAVMLKEGRGKKCKFFYRVKDIHMDEVNIIFVYRKKNARFAAKDIESLNVATIPV